jgi:hypothetical protein
MSHSPQARNTSKRQAINAINAAAFANPASGLGDSASRRRPGYREHGRLGGLRGGSRPGLRLLQVSRRPGAIRSVSGDPFRFLD